MTTTEQASARNRGGRPSRGHRVETKLPADALVDVEYLIGHLGSDRSEVIARLVRHGLAHRDRLADDVAVIRAWAAEDGVLDHLHQERLAGREAAAARRLMAVQDDVWELGLGFPDGTLGRLVVRCYPDA